MTFNDRTALRYQIEEHSAGLVARAEKTAGAMQSPELKTLQIKLLTRQAQSGYGVAHICNWLRYQQDRVSEWRTSGLADAILQDIAELKEEANRLTRLLYHKDVERQLPLVWLALVRRYLAYLERWYPVMRVRKGGSDDELD